MLQPVSRYKTTRAWRAGHSTGELNDSLLHTKPTSCGVQQTEETPILSSHHGKAFLSHANCAEANCSTPNNKACCQNTSQSLSAVEFHANDFSVSPDTGTNSVVENKQLSAETLNTLASTPPRQTSQGVQPNTFTASNVEEKALVVHSHDHEPMTLCAKRALQKQHPMSKHEKKLQKAKQIASIEAEIRAQVYAGTWVP